MATMSERPGFWRPPQGYRNKPRPQSCIWTPSESQWTPSPTFSNDTNSMSRNSNVASGSPASDAGLRPGDVLLGVGNKSTTNPPMTHADARDMINQSGNTLNVQVQRPQGRSSGTPLSSTSISPVYSSEQPSSQTPYRPVPLQRGVIPAIHPLDYDSSIRKPESNTEEYLREKAREQWAITKQTYRTLPLIEPRPKVRRDWPTGSYLRHMEGPSWQEVPKTLINPTPKLQNVMSRYGQGVQQNNPGVVHLQYNSPINMYSEENVANNLMPRSATPAQPPRPGSVPPQMMSGRSHLQKPINVDITQSPTYQLLQENEECREHHQHHGGVHSSQNPVGHQTGHGYGHSPKHSHSPIGLHSPAYPTQTPYFKSLMNSLLPNPGM